jgi:hypothetical protein
MPWFTLQAIQDIYLPVNGAVQPPALATLFSNSIPHHVDSFLLRILSHISLSFPRVWGRKAESRNIRLSPNSFLCKAFLGKLTLRWSRNFSPFKTPARRFIAVFTRQSGFNVLFKVSLITQLYRKESLHLPRHPVAATVLRHITLFLPRLPAEDKPTKVLTKGGDLRWAQVDVPWSV